MGFKLGANNVKDCADEKLGITEFAEMVYISRQHIIKSPYYNMNNKATTIIKRKLQIYGIHEEITKEKFDSTIYYITNLDSMV